MSWKKLNSRTVWENDWMRVLEDEVINPGGGKNLYGHVHFKNLAVAIVPLDDDDNVWLVGQQRYTLGAWSWELPMGGAPKGEAPLEAAQRELREETGLSATTWTEIMRLHTSNSITDELRKLSLGEAVQMVKDGEITDAISAAALLRVATR